MNHHGKSIYYGHAVFVQQKGTTFSARVSPDDASSNRRVLVSTYSAARIGLQQWSFSRRQQMPTKINNSGRGRWVPSQQESTKINRKQQIRAESAKVSKSQHRLRPYSSKISNSQQKSSTKLCFVGQPAVLLRANSRYWEHKGVCHRGSEKKAQNALAN